MTKIVETDTNGNILATNTFVFDANERLTSKTYGAVGQTYRPVYEKNSNGYIYPDNEVLGITLDGKFTVKITKDGLRRASTKTFQIGTHTLFSESYGYLSTPKDGNTIATEIVSSVASHVYGTDVNSQTLNYTYDKAGNLEAISNGTSLLVKYYYDGLNRLKREDNYTATVKSVNLLELDEPVEVYNFEVEDCHTYFVGELSVLVHNAGCGQDHHFLSNKNKTYTPKFKEVTNKYDLNLNGKWNVQNLKDHVGRHTNNYHEYMLKQIQSFDKIANGNKDIFLNLFDGLKTVISTNQWMMYM